MKMRIDVTPSFYSDRKKKKDSSSYWNRSLNVIHDVKCRPTFLKEWLKHACLAMLWILCCSQITIFFGVSYVCNNLEHFFQHNPENGVAILMAPPGTTVNSLGEQAKLGHRSSDCLDFPSVFQPRWDYNVMAVHDVLSISNQEVSLLGNWCTKTHMNSAQGDWITLCSEETSASHIYICLY